MTETRRSCILIDDMTHGMAGLPPPLVRWIAAEILPHEPALRRWLARAFPRCTPDDIVQEAYCHLAEMEGFAHVADPRRYLFQVARNIVLTQLRRDKVVRIEAIGSVADMEAALAGEIDERSPERIVSGRVLLDRIDALLRALPERARSIVKLRKLDGLSQREIAARLGITETIVENDLARGLRSILAGLTDAERAELPLDRKRADGRTRNRRGD